MGKTARRSPADSVLRSSGDATAIPPVPLDSAIVFAPAGELVPLALEATDRAIGADICGDGAQIAFIEQILPIVHFRNVGHMDAGKAPSSVWLPLSTSHQL